MKNFSFFIIVSLLVLVFTIDYSKVADGGIEMPFGGRHILTLGPETCDCGGNSHLILDYRTNRIISLYRSPSSIFYDYYNSDGNHQLGTYTPTASQDCRVYAYNDCVTIMRNDADYGNQPGTGTTLY